MMIVITIIAPAMAATDMATSPKNPMLLNAVPAMLPESKTMKATPKLAPELIPSSEGPASGLRNTVCICNPLIERPEPAASAVAVWGNRDFQMIFSQMVDSFPLFAKIFHIDFSGMEIVPSTKLRRKSSMMDMKMRRRMVIVFFIYFSSS